MKERVISAIIMILISVPFLIIGNIPFLIFVTILGNMALYELLKLQKKIPIDIKIITHFLNTIIILKSLIKIKMELIIIITILLLLGMLVLKKDYHYKNAFLLIGMLLFIGIAFNNLITIRNRSLLEFIYILIITVVTDTCALLIGKKFGRHKLLERISPNKTIEGLIGGCLVGTILASIYNYLCLDIFPNLFIIIFITFLLSLIGEFGDLIKSSIKRQEKIKDFSNLIPGHGGILDRVDSLLFVSMIYILIINLI